MMPEREIDNIVWLSIECSMHTKTALEKLIGLPTVVVENGGARTNPETGETASRLYLYYRLKTPTGSREELAKLELARELAAKIVGGNPSDMPPERLSPKIYRILTQNLDAEINLDAALRVLWKAAENGGTPHTRASEGQGLVPEPAQAGDTPAAGGQSQSLATVFLEKLRPGGPWVLTAIVPDGPTKTITVRTADQVEAFVRKHDGKAGLYYSVNPTRTPLSKKAKKTDIAAIEYALGDLDPADGETSEAAKARYLAQLNDVFEPKPTAGVDSGNGIQGLWKLKERIILGEPINGKFSPEDQEKIADVEARIAAVMRRLGSKAGTQNIDRILRLPGTTNLPNAKKRKEGRVVCQTKLLWFEDTSYPLDAFPKEEPEKPEKSKKPKKAAGREADVLEQAISESAPKGERSEVVWAVVNEMLRRGSSTKC
jgi:hypothetical protein